MPKAVKKLQFRKLRELSGLAIEDVSVMTGCSERTVYRWDNGDSMPKKIIMDALNDHIEKRKQVSINKKALFSFIDLFAGIGGMRIGFESTGGQCVYTSEWNEFAQKTYMANHGCHNHQFGGDITKTPAEKIPAHDLLLGGFPCQPFSIAGVSKKNSMGKAHGFLCETQGTLFFDVARIIGHHRPKAFLLENVKNLASHDHGRTFRIILKTLTEDLGYKVSYRIIDAKSYVPQHRERIFIAGFREEVGFNLNELSIPRPEDGPRLGSILHPEDGSEESEPPYTTGKSAKVDIKYTLSDKLWNYLQRYAEKHKEQGNGFGFGLFSKDDVARTLSARYYKDGSEILIKQPGKNPRRLTPRECARLMGYEIKGKRKFIIPVSDTQAYKQFGNGVVVPVVEAIAKYMTPYILKIKDEKESENELLPVIKHESILIHG